MDHSRIMVVNPLKQNPEFKLPEKEGCFTKMNKKAIKKKKKMLVASIFSFFYNVFILFEMEKSSSIEQHLISSMQVILTWLNVKFCLLVNCRCGLVVRAFAL